MDAKELSEVLQKHELWLQQKDGGERADLQEAYLRWADLREADLREADLRGADLRRADLRRADLQGANLRRADLQGADLREANLREADWDFSVFPLWCGSFDIKVDRRLPIQLIYHICKMDIQTDNEKLNELVQSDAFIEVANMFHRVDGCGRIGKKGKEKENNAMEENI
jgi:hypothetical protein